MLWKSKEDEFQRECIILFLLSFEMSLNSAVLDDSTERKEEEDINK